MVDARRVGRHVHVHCVGTTPLSDSKRRVLPVGQDRRPAIEAPWTTKWTSAVEPAKHPRRLWVKPLSGHTRREDHHGRAIPRDRQPRLCKTNKRSLGVVMLRIVEADSIWWICQRQRSALASEQRVPYLGVCGVAADQSMWTKFIDNAGLAICWAGINFRRIVGRMSFRRIVKNGGEIFGVPSQQVEIHPVPVQAAE